MVLQCNEPLHEIVISNLSSVVPNMVKDKRATPQVYSSYGFRVAYEVKSGPRRRDQCSLLECNMNGECLTHFTRDGRNIR